MDSGTSLIARLRLECSGIASHLAKVPVLGRVLRGIGNSLLPRGTLVWTRIAEGPVRGMWILLDARSAGDLRRGDRERAVQEALGRYLGPGKVFYDIGANTGYFSLFAAVFGGDSAKVYAFEASPDVVSRLTRTIERNALAGVTVVEAAVWSENGEVTFDRCPGSPDRMVGHVIEESGPERSDCVRVAAVTLDHFVQTAPAPDVLKCDVEGAELEVLRGAVGLLHDKKPVVICEVHSHENLQALLPFFHQLGYRVRMIEPEGKLPVHILAEAGR